MKNDTAKMYIVRKYIMASSAIQAIKKEKTSAVHDVWIDEEWKNAKHDRLADSIGFIKD